MTGTAIDAGPRRFTVDDLLSLDDFQRHYGRACALSPNGASLCFVVVRPLADATRFDRLYLGGLDRAELHLFELPGRTTRRLAGDVRTGHACFSPAWAPDGRWIAALTTTTSDTAVLPVLIEPGTGNVTPLAGARSVDLSRVGSDGPFRWLSADRVALPLLADGMTPWASHLQRSLSENARAARDACANGQHPTADILDSASFGDTPVPPPAWHIADLATGVLRALSADECADAGLSLDSARDSAPATPDTPGPDADMGGDVRRERISASTDDRYAAFIEHHRDGTRLTMRLAGAHRSTAVFETNRRLAEIAVGTTRRLHCRDAHGGRPRRVDVLLPPDFAGAPVPAVVWIYPGATPGRRPHMFHEPDCPSPFNYQLLAAHGFAVVDVDMADVFGVEPSSMADRMLDDIRAAVDAATEAGYVDRDRLHLCGQSLGGWATMMLLAHTPMFRSGISTAGISDPAALHTSLDPRLRYEAGGSDHPGRFSASGKLISDNSWGIDAAPWARPDAYEAISPIRHAPRIATPLLLIHGDADYIPLEQSERMFAALTQLKRTAQLVRYWGDDHVPCSPANIADRHRRMIDWLRST